MPTECENCKANPVDILKSLRGADLSDKAKLVAILEAFGVTDREQVETILEAKPSTLRQARQALKIQRQKSSGAGNPAPEIQRCAENPAQTPEIQRQKSSDLSRARANTESLRDTLVSKTEDSSLSEPDVSDQGEEVTPKAKRRHSYTHGFEEFWKAYPDTTNNSKPEAFKQWRMLTSVEQHNATDGLRHLRAICQRQPDYRCVHACRYLSQRRWESYPSTADRLAGKVVPLSDFKPHPQPMRTITEKELHAMVLADEAMADGARAHG